MLEPLWLPAKQGPLLPDCLQTYHSAAVPSALAWVLPCRQRSSAFDDPSTRPHTGLVKEIWEFECSSTNFCFFAKQWSWGLLNRLNILQRSWLRFSIIEDLFVRFQNFNKLTNSQPWPDFGQMPTIYLTKDLNLSIFNAFDEYIFYVLGVLPRFGQPHPLTPSSFGEYKKMHDACTSRFHRVSRKGLRFHSVFALGSHFMEI